MEHLQRTEGPEQLVPIPPQAGRHAFWPLNTLTKRIQEACLYDCPANSVLCLDWAHKKQKPCMRLLWTYSDFGIFGLTSGEIRAGAD